MKANFWDEGYAARKSGLLLSSNPYGRTTAESTMWIRGFLSAGIAK